MNKFYTDGSTRNNQERENRGGAAAVFLGEPIVTLKRQLINTTNNICELTAIKMAIEYALEQKMEEITIYSDSDYSIKALTVWIDGWKRKNWINSKRQPVLNKELIQEIDFLQNCLKVNYVKVKGHSTDKYNSMADKAACEAADGVI